jgi:hypothetical protein
LAAKWESIFSISSTEINRLQILQFDQTQPNRA